MSRRYYNPATGIDLLPDVPGDRIRSTVSGHRFARGLATATGLALGLLATGFAVLLL